MSDKVTTPEPKAEDAPVAKWHWINDQLVDRIAGRTLLRDVNFWNITDDEEALIASAPTLGEWQPLERSDV